MEKSVITSWKVLLRCLCLVERMLKKGNGFCIAKFIVETIQYSGARYLFSLVIFRKCGIDSEIIHSSSLSWTPDTRNSVFTERGHLLRQNCLSGTAFYQLGECCGHTSSEENWRRTVDGICTNKCTYSKACPSDGGAKDGSFVENLWGVIYKTEKLPTEHFLHPSCLYTLPYVVDANICFKDKETEV